MKGSDYSLAALEFATEIARGKSVHAEFIRIDLLDGLEEEFKFDCVLDKGTSDAISLNGDLEETERNAKYATKVHSMLEKEGLFLITSCNWTEEELIEKFKHYFHSIHGKLFPL